MRATLNPILITGPTASGKSGLALQLASRLGGTIINADSMQVYRDLHILTARPSAEDEAVATHMLYGHVDGHEGYSAGRFQREAADAISAAHNVGRVPIIVGGTGLYFKALLEGLSPIPAIPDAVRSHWRQQEREYGADALHTVLCRDDPVMAARLDPNDGQRIVRALEVVHATGKSLDDWQQQPGTPVIDPAACLRLIVMPDRDVVYRQSEERVDAMMAAGALDEVRALQVRHLDVALPVMRALGVRPLIQHLSGQLARDETVTAVKAETRQFIKRQLTWFKGNMSAWKAITTQQTESYLDEIIAFIDS